jgi:hypothetical protein
MHQPSVLAHIESAETQLPLLGALQRGEALRGAFAHTLRNSTPDEALLRCEHVNCNLGLRQAGGCKFPAIHAQTVQHLGINCLVLFGL